MEHRERRQHLETLLDDIRAQRKVDSDEVLMELIHLVFELDDEIGQLRDRIAHQDPKG